ncbi:hypothetical protein A2625_04645 [candidate division WOR-1 bacterium RIFCSPHIGHO2_01_FULL_53_15]|uniref:RNA-binding protein n=1 Tax=candidate division WOR-1 bacterium RIFCSPHIGHO2_01_FULL_53_15 TaxID=1802564 RepID=A0A1F4PZH5_UNCSA|nr:MAG: hypothetical protein A2625_04645 [candidate division WOR-1 bacterium RIFCSPHIGHO2_01_FULL_53_15]OGC10624.1 MAG: hypothetical protein A3D23_03865 [candidate division WOR-1 bacterium RIFCSPHIGHO2_02_FULL_53_26]
MPEKVAGIFARLDQGIGRAVENCRLVALWNSVADDRVRRNTEAVKIAERTLYVLTASPAWAAELGFLKKAFISKFNDLAGRDAISDIRFKPLGGPIEKFSGGE